MAVVKQNDGKPLYSAGGKFLTFRLGDEEYGIEIIKVREIIGLVNITRVPKTPYHVRGIMKLRGQVISVVDLRMKFDMEATEDTDETCIIVADIKASNGSVSIGMVVDSVSEVLDIKASDIEPAPSMSGDFDSSFILGMGMVKNNVRILLNIDQVFNDDDLGSLPGMDFDEDLTRDEDSEIETDVAAKI
jgi:purine-binding chemotaxis protein CheW